MCLLWCDTNFTAYIHIPPFHDLPGKCVLVKGVNRDWKQGLSFIEIKYNNCSYYHNLLPGTVLQWLI